jgi:ribonuclease HII
MPTMLSMRYEEDGKLEVGIDEAGRGSFWGDLYAAAVIWPDEKDWTDEHRILAPDLRDSKKIAPKKRERIYEDIKRLAYDYGIGSVSAAEIDEFGVQWANVEAFQRALDNMAFAPDRILIDGVLGLARPPEGAEVHTIIEGDAQYMSIAAASILAKVGHDQWLRSVCIAEPALDEKYGLQGCKGYGTASHRKGIEEHGLDVRHRRRFIKFACLTHEGVPHTALPPIKKSISTTFIEDDPILQKPMFVKRSSK